VLIVLVVDAANLEDVVRADLHAVGFAFAAGEVNDGGPASLFCAAAQAGSLRVRDRRASFRRLLPKQARREWCEDEQDRE
jgi:hypothetical protein